MRSTRLLYGDFLADVGTVRTAARPSQFQAVTDDGNLDSPTVRRLHQQRELHAQKVNHCHTGRPHHLFITVPDRGSDVRRSSVK